MELNLSPQDEAFRTEVRRFLEEKNIYHVNEALIDEVKARLPGNCPP